MKEFFGFGGYTRPAEGAYSWQHLTFVTGLLLIMTVLAVLLGKQNRVQTERVKNRVLIWSAFLIDGLEILKIVVLCFRGGLPATGKKQKQRKEQTKASFHNILLKSAK